MEDRFTRGGPPSDIHECRTTCGECIPHSIFRKHNNIALPLIVILPVQHSLLDATPASNLSDAMFESLILRRLLYYAFLLLNSAACKSAAQDACIYRSGEMVVNSVVVVKHTIHIITSVPHNTTFQVNTGLTITVDDAPTSLDLLTTYFSKSTAIETMNGSVIPSNELQIIL